MMRNLDRISMRAWELRTEAAMLEAESADRKTMISECLKSEAAWLDLLVVALRPLDAMMQRCSDGDDSRRRT